MNKIKKLYVVGVSLTFLSSLVSLLAIIVLTNIFERLSCRQFTDGFGMPVTNETGICGFVWSSIDVIIFLDNILTLSGIAILLYATSTHSVKLFKGKKIACAIFAAIASLASLAVFVFLLFWILQNGSIIQ